ncbi:MAG TPA: hypothetical protein VEA58_06405 [Anaerovoracaceae bacterium]|nr:hypothetical protein [Anaerovoracaceae bacterium]
MNAKKIKTIVTVFVVIVLIFCFVKCSSPGGFGSAQTDETTSSSIDVSTMPANSEFSNEESD